MNRFLPSRPRWRVPLLAFTVFVAGCAVAVATAAEKSTPRRARAGDEFSGQWQGNWQSAGGHHGKLLCTLSRLDSRRYHAHFTAYWLAFHGGYDVELRAKRRGSALVIAGEKNLGFLYGGVYHYEGTIRPDAFQVRYTASSDHGTFLLKRP